MTTRRKFIRQAVGTSLAASALTTSAASYARVLGANDRVNVVVMGIGGRGKQLLQDFIDDGNVSVVGLCDADSRRVMEGQATLAENDQGQAAGGSDIRKILNDTNADVLVIATPDHWHAPGALIGMDAGLHVYLEKPVGHNPREGELLIESQAKHGTILQVGNQQRSALESRDLIARIRAGELGDICRVCTWYANNRGSIGNGKQASPPDWLDWEQWQGPAPRRDFQDNVVHYNWHWFWRWGTGETCNNAMHELDVARWAIGADYPDRVSVTASRQFFKEDDWEMVRYDACTLQVRQCNSRVGISQLQQGAQVRSRTRYVNLRYQGVRARGSQRLYDVRPRRRNDRREDGGHHERDHGTYRRRIAESPAHRQLPRHRQGHRKRAALTDRGRSQEHVVMPSCKHGLPDRRDVAL